MSLWFRSHIQTNGNVLTARKMALLLPAIDFGGAGRIVRNAVLTPPLPAPEGAMPPPPAAVAGRVVCANAWVSVTPRADATAELDLAPTPGVSEASGVSTVETRDSNNRSKINEPAGTNKQTAGRFETNEKLKFFRWFMSQPT